MSKCPVHGRDCQADAAQVSELNRQGVRNLDAIRPITKPARVVVAPPAARDEIMEQFEYGHLPAGPMRETSKLFAELAGRVQSWLPRCEERGVALRKLLEGKDAAVRAARKL